MQHQWPEAMLTAIHEARHATISRVLGLWGGSAKIYETPNGVAGFAQTEYIEHMPRVWGKRRTAAAAIHSKILICAAGAAAQEEVCGASRNAAGDHEQIDWLLSFLPRRSRRGDRLHRFARQLVRRHKDAILRVAAELAIGRELDGSQIDALVRGDV